MKAFMEEYGLSILIAIVSFVLIVMATPLRDVVRRGLGDTFTEFKTENVKYVNLCIHPNNGTTSNTTWCTQVPKDSLLKYIKQDGYVPKTQMFNVENEPINQKGEKVENADDSADVIGEFLRASADSIKPTNSGKLDLVGLRNTEFGTLKKDTIIPMTENKTFYAIWEGVAVGEQIDLKGFRKGGSVLIDGIEFDIAKVDKDEKIALIISKKVYLYQPSAGGAYILKETHESNNEAVQGDEYQTAAWNIEGVHNDLWNRITKKANVDIWNENGVHVYTEENIGYFYNPSLVELEDLYDTSNKKIAYSGTIEMPYYTRTVSNDSTPGHETWCVITTKGEEDCSTGSRAGMRLTARIKIDTLQDGEFEIIK